MTNYLSLGLLCQPAVFAVEHKLVKSRAEGRPTSVFDLCLATGTALCHFIESGFADFFDDIELIENPKGTFLNERGVLLYSFAGNADYGDLIINRKYGMIFNHESPGHPFLATSENWNSPLRFTEDDFSEFRQRYTRRIKAFLGMIETSLENAEPLIFLLRADVDTATRAANSLKNTYPALKFNIRYEDFLELDAKVDKDLNGFFFGGKKMADDIEINRLEDIVIKGWPESP